MGSQKTITLRKEFATLISQGKTQKAGAELLDITEKMAGAWKKSLPSVTYSQQRKDIQKRITEALKDNKASATDIAKLTDAAVKLEKCIKYAIDNPLM